LENKELIAYTRNRLTTQRTTRKNPRGDMLWKKGTGYV
jgi:hypothetical protein